MRFLKKLREKRGFTKTEAGQQIGVSRQTYTAYEEKAEGLRLKTLSRIRRAFGLSWNNLGRLIDDEFGDS